MIILTILFVATMIALLYSISKFQDFRNKVRTENQNRINNLIPIFVNHIQNAETLYDVFYLHKLLWASGIHHKNFGPDEYGMFRTKNITTMKSDEVYLGNIWGLFTKSLPDWNSCSDEDAKRIVLKQYKDQLISNL